MANNITIGKGQQAATANIWVSPSEDAINLELSVSDNRLRNLGIETDGLEKPFVLIPKHGTWTPYFLQYGGTYSNRGSNEIRDGYNLHIDLAGEGFDLNEIKQRGVAFGLDVSGAYGSNPTTVWLQGFDDNYKP
ncbi:MAG: hypothetical protein H6729_06760 [Deltaproteobacteria bacterium]|nr:hypothetical protein [Deltaproteobacteria bacterium]